MSFASKNSGNQLKMLILSAVFGALLIAIQVVMGFLPNIELVTTLLLVFAAVCGKYAYLSVYVFVLAEGLIYGFASWWISYIYIWLIPATVGILMRRCKNPIFPAAFSAIFGLLFGLLTAPPILLIEKHAVIPYLIANIPYDIFHCVGNAVLTALLYLPLKIALKKAVEKLQNKKEGSI